MSNAHLITSIAQMPCLLAEPKTDVEIDKWQANVYTFRCTRPILGDTVIEKDYIFYADIDLSNGLGQVNSDLINYNAKMDARVLFFATERMQVLMAVAGTKYEERYLELPEDRRAKAVPVNPRKLNDLTFEELSDRYDAALKLLHRITNTV